MKQRLLEISSELKSYHITEKLFILFAMICGFCITSEYSVTKPVSYSVFISHFSASYLPYAWLATVPVNLLIIMLYNKCLTRFGCFKTTLFTVLTTAGFNVIATFTLKDIAVFSFLHFIWKDIYVLMMFQFLWSVIHSTISSGKTKYLYGFLYGMGGLGAALGSFIPALLATKAGSEMLLLATPIIYSVFIFSYKGLLTMRSKMETAGIKVSSIEFKKKDAKGGFSLIKNSKYLKFILLIVVFMQISASLIDFQFNSYLEQAIPIKDMRTAYLGKMFSVVHTVNIFLQLFGAYILVQFVGLRRSHFLVPAFFTLNIISFIFFPVFRVVTMCYASVKSFDYSVFTIIKEMLYVPLKVEEKFRAKAVIDVFAYRSSKAISSLLVLGLQMLAITSVTKVISWILLGIFTLWLLSVFYLFEKQESPTEQAIS
ncbi:hypothetical protein COB11_08300 [Candidatus Aerophobetes bacterium]|uniref:ADP,ATP carrier protein n=1 Tax=Aerophobetes bacterium TaxID=2030807 RepID=A0A2A4YA52_UNCAE|nr:MAG: hypothetical protein COB11_08300 [Candidatus Aerophobetes bacterium]